MTYSLPYIFILTVFAVLAVIYAQRQENKEDTLLCSYITGAAIAVFYVFFAFRGYVYSDWVGYSETFQNVEWEDIFDITNKKKQAIIHEPGFTGM